MRFSFSNKKFLILMIVILLMSPVGVFAFTPGPGAFVPGLPFGGLVIFSVPCICSANLWIWFAPLYPLPLPPVGPLVYQPGYTTLYGDFAIGITATWHLGSYLPIIGKNPTKLFGICWIETKTACVPIESFGVMNKVGTGLP